MIFKLYNEIGDFMIDLHLHLDGSLSKEDFIFLSQLHGYDLGEGFPDNIYVNKDCKSLEEYLERFNLPLELLQDELSLAYVTKSLVERLYKMGYIYAEIRFAPQLHTQRGMDQERAVISVLSGLKSGLKNKKDFDANVILCCMRQGTYEDNLETIKIAEKYSKSKVVSVDLAGPEAFLDGKEYINLFNEAKNRNLNITIHAGEACGSSEVMNAIINLGAKRIGHGVHLELTRENVKLITEKRIAFEFCPTSNLQTTSLDSYDNVPIKEFDGVGIPVTINSDNMTVSGTNVLEEYRHLYQIHHFKYFEVRHFLNNAINAAFISEEEKQVLRRRLDSKLMDFYAKVIATN